MKNRKLAFLFVSNIIPLFVGMGLFPILPLYAARFGATHTAVGLYYAVTYTASVAGIALTGWLGTRMSRRALFVIGGSLGVPALALLGSATAFWQVIILTAAIWFSGAVTITLVNVLTGLLSDGERRGASFGLLFAAYPLGAVVGGAAVGQLVVWQGYAFMFAVLALIWSELPHIGLLGLPGLSYGQAASVATEVEAAPLLGSAFMRLLLAALLSALAINVGRLGTSLSMQALGFTAGAVASTAVVSGIIAAPISIFIGRLSDRVGHRRAVLAGYALAIGGAVLLMVATDLWHFWVAATLLFVGWCVNAALTSALAADTLAPEALGRGLPQLNAMDSLASILGFAGAGYVMDAFGSFGLYLIAVTALLLAAPLLATLGRHRHAAAPAHAASQLRGQRSVARR
jgi:MFS family permease